MSAPTCYCGSSTTRQSNALIYGIEYGNGRAFICDRFPQCQGFVGTHPNGQPLGTVPDPETRELRKLVHAAIDPIWQTGKLHRGQVYNRISRALGIKSYHTGETTADECRKVLELIPQIFKGYAPEILDKSAN